MHFIDTHMTNGHKLPCRHEDRQRSPKIFQQTKPKTTFQPCSWSQRAPCPKRAALCAHDVEEHHHKQDRIGRPGPVGIEEDIGLGIKSRVSYDTCARVHFALAHAKLSLALESSSSFWGKHASRATHLRLPIMSVAFCNVPRYHRNT